MLLIGTRSAAGDDLLLTVTAATARPVQLRLDRAPSADELRHAIDRQIANGDYFTDVPAVPAGARVRTFSLRAGSRIDQVGVTLENGTTLAHGGIGGTASSLELGSGEYGLRRYRLGAGIKERVRR